MECTRCGADAVTFIAYSGAHHCESHFRESVERRVRKRIRTDGLVPRSATPEDPETWVIGLSGGKDSVVLATILHETFADDPRIELLALTIHEGIDGYRDESIDAARRLVDRIGMRHVEATYEEEFGVRMDEVVEDDPVNMAACAYCGVFRRDVLSRYAREHDADWLLTGHNLDDEAQTALMNLLEGDVAQVAKHFDASLAPREERSGQEAFVPRAKPLRDVPEKEVALYAHLRDLPVHMATCPHSSEAYRGEIQRILYDLEENHPGTRHSILSGYEELARLAADRYGVSKADAETSGGDTALDREPAETDGGGGDGDSGEGGSGEGGSGEGGSGEGGSGEGGSGEGGSGEGGSGDGDSRADLSRCENCGAPTTGKRCRKCDLLEALGA